MAQRIVVQDGNISYSTSNPSSFVDFNINGQLNVATDLIVGNNSATPGIITSSLSENLQLMAGAGGNLKLMTSSGGVILINNLQWPTTAGASGQVLTTDGVSTLSWTNGGGTGTVTQLLAGTNISLSPSNGLGTVTISSTAGGVTQLTAGTNITLTPSTGLGNVTISTTVGGVTQLTAGPNITLTPSDGLGNVTISGTPAGVSQILAGSNITLSPTDGVGVVTINSTASGVTQLTAGTGISISPSGGLGNVTVTNQYVTSGGSVTAGTQTPSANVTTSTSTIINCLLSNVFILTTLSTNISSLSITNSSDGQTINVFFTQPATGGPFSVTWPSTFKWPGGTAGILSTTASAVDMLIITYLASTGFFYATLMNGFA